jgi:subtilisin family serine protease
VNYTTKFSGTSAAAPQVAVAAALLYAVDPSRTESQVRDLILDNATYWGRADDFGAGLLDIGAAIAVQAELSGPSEVYSYKSCTWYAQGSGGAPPYQYQWYRDGSPVGTSASYTANSGGSDFNVSVKVTDSVGVFQFRSLDVTVVPGSPWVLTCEVE